MIQPTVLSNVSRDLPKAINAWRRGVDYELLPKLAARLREQARARVSRTKTSPQGRRWPPRQPSLARHGLLTKTRKMLRSIQTARESRSTMKVGSSVEYAKFHNFGTVKMPQRQFLGFDPEDVEDAVDAWTAKFGSRIRTLARELR